MGVRGDVRNLRAPGEYPVDRVGASMSQTISVGFIPGTTGFSPLLLYGMCKV